MAYETKVILSLLSESIGRAKSVKECYNYVVKAANVEGVQLPDYAEFQKSLEKEQDEN
jgi:hypothetical protein